MKRLVAIGFVVLAFFLPTGASAQPREPFVLVVAASNYKHGIRPLSGPKNDSTLLVGTLRELGVPRENMLVLADSLETSDLPEKIVADGEPTRRAILDGFAWLRERASRSGRVLIYLAGHGSRAPQAGPLDDREDDGLDEVFLPIDTTGPTQTRDAFVNQISDDDIDALIQPLLQSGVEVWLIADTCHSGSIARAGETGVARYVDPLRLGIAMSRMRNVLAPRAETGRRFGEVSSPLFVGFYGSNDADVAYEDLLPVRGDNRRKHGVLTWNVVQALRARSSRTYGDLATRIQAGAWDWGGALATPTFEGALSRRPMLGEGSGSFLRVSVRAGQVYISAGAVDGAVVGARVALFDLSKANEPQIARASIADVGLGEARLGSLSEAFSRERFADGGTTFGARIIAQPVGLGLRIAPPALLQPENAGPEDAALLPVISARLEAALKSGGGRSYASEIVPAGEPADLYPMVHKGRLWLFRRGSPRRVDGPELPLSLSTIDLATSAPMADVLYEAARGASVLRIAQIVQNSPASRSLAVYAWVQDEGSPPIDMPCANPPKDDVAAIPNSVRRLASTDESLQGAFPLGHCDLLYLRLRNTGLRPLDVTPIYVDPWLRPFFLNGYTGSEFGGLRLNPGESRIYAFRESHYSDAGAKAPVGQIQLVFLTIYGVQSQSARDFRQLDRRYRGGEFPKRGAQDSLEALIGEAIGGTPTRASSVVTLDDGGAVKFDLQTR